jgi:hypothetical protein
MMAAVGQALVYQGRYDEAAGSAYRMRWRIQERDLGESASAGGDGT